MKENKKKILQNYSYWPIRVNHKDIFQALQQPKNHPVGPQKFQRNSQIDILKGLD